MDYKSSKMGATNTFTVLAELHRPSVVVVSMQVYNNFGGCCTTVRR